MEIIFICRFSKYFGQDRKVGIVYIHNSRESYLEISLYNRYLQIGKILKE